MIPPVLRRRRSALPPGINLTPLLDTIFNLLFFFMLATTIRNEAYELSVHLPTAGAAVPAEREQPPPTITVDAEGHTWFQDRMVVPEELELELTVLAGRAVDEIIVRGDRDAQYGNVIRIMDLARQAGIKSVLLDAERPQPAYTPRGE